MKKKLLLIGWDAADWKVINELMAEGKMPTLQRMVQQGSSGNLRTLQPPFSPMLWTSIATGKRPFKHGIYGFTEPTPKQDGVQAMTITSRSSKAIWNILNQNDRRSVVVGWWPSHPAEPIRGTMVSDFFHKAPEKPGEKIPLRENCVHPPERFREIAELRIHPTELTAEDILPFIPDGADIDQEVDGSISSIMKITAECSSVHAAATHLMQEEEWDFAAIYYDAIDHYSHGFMKYRAPQQNFISDHNFKMYRHVVDMGYIFHDMMLKQLLELAGEDTTVMLISDHGFHPDHLRPQRLPNEPAGPATEHRDYGIFVATGPGIKPAHTTHGANLLDITPTILACYGLPTGEDMDGRVLSDIFADERTPETIESWESIDGDTGEHPEGFAISAEESQAALEQLVALGYIDAPEENSSKAVSNCIRELDYNLSRAFLDADLQGEAAPILLKLYRDHPIEFRFGIQLAATLQALGEHSGLKSLIADMGKRWQATAIIAGERLVEVEKLQEERKRLWDEFKKVDETKADDDFMKMARVDREGQPILFSQDEGHRIKKLQSMVMVNPQSLAFLSSNAAAGTGDFEEALELLMQAQTAYEGLATFHFHHGNILISLGRLEEAEESFCKGLSIDESHPKSLMGLARCRVEMGRYEEALEAAQGALDLQYQFPLAHFYAGLAHQGMGNIESSVASLQMAISQNPNFEEAYSVLADIHETTGTDTKLADQHRTTMRDLADHNREHDDIPMELVFDPTTEEELRELIPHVVRSASEEEWEPSLTESLPKTMLAERAAESRPQVTIVSGLPRSGTSMMMQMLDAGGVPIFTDGHRVADENNPKGYYEVDLTKGIAKRNSWVRDCNGKTVKVVAPLIPYLPSSVDYRVVYMRRPVEEVVRSQTKMLARLGKKSSAVSDEQQTRVMHADVSKALSLLNIHGNPVLSLNYAEVIADPGKAAARIKEFLEMDLDEPAMAGVVDPTLHREKKSIDSVKNGA